MPNEFKALRKSLRKTMKQYDDPILEEQISIIVANLRELEHRSNDYELRKLMMRNLAELVPALAMAKRTKAKASIRIVARND